MMSRWLSPAAVLILAGTVTVGSSRVLAADPVPAPAVRLATAMQLSRGALFGVTVALQRSVEQGNGTRAQLDCVSTLPLEPLTQEFGRALAAVLSEQDLNSAAAYFESASGRKVTAKGFEQLHTALKVPFAGQTVDMTEAEKRAFLAFSETPAGVKLLTQRIVESSQAKDIYFPYLMNKVNSCLAH